MNKLQRTVLVIDQQKEVHLVIRQALRQATSIDYHVTTAINGAQALAYLQQQQPDCLLLADQVVDRAGLPLLPQIVQQAAPHIYPVILLLDTPDTAIDPAALPAGAHDVLCKTEVSAFSLQRAIHHAVDKVALQRQLAEQQSLHQLVMESSPDCIKLLDRESHHWAEALRQSEARYRSLFDTMDEGFCVLEMIFDAADQPVDYRFLEVNPAFVRFTGLTDAVGKTARELVPNLENHWVEIYGKIAQTGEARRFIEGSAAMGRWFDVYAFQVGEPASRRVALLFNNITERKQIEEALRASEERLRQITDNVPGLISVVNDRGEYELVNQNYQRWLGLEPTQLIGQALSAVLGVDEAYQVAQPNLQRALAGETVTFENRLATPQGAPLEIITTYMPRRNGDGRVTGCYILAMDISERKQMEESLRQSEETARQRLAELEAIYDSAPIGLCVLDQQLRWVRINERLAEMNGFPVQAHLGRSVRELLPDLAPMAEPVLRQILEKDQPVLNLELHGETPAQLGVERTWREHMFPLHNHDGAVIGINIVAEEITERKRQERELKELNATLERRVADRTKELEEKNQELERSNRELDKFAYVASHDLKSPLRAIDNLAQWIKEDAGALLPAPSQAHLSKLQGRVRRMEKLLDDLLVYSRVGRIAYDAEMIDLRSLLQNLIALLLPADFKITVEEPLPIFRSQRVPLESVLRNLLDNAIKHHDRSDGHVRIAAYERGQWIEFLIADDGPGIDPQFHSRIFEVFQTLQPRDKVEGSGIGLAIVKKSIESQGGAITVKSTLGAGATFCFIWPKG